MLSIGKQQHVALRSKQPILKFLMVGGIAYKSLLMNQMFEPESQVTYLTIKVCLLWSEVLSVDSWQKLKEYLQLYINLDRVSSMRSFNTASFSWLEKRS